MDRDSRFLKFEKGWIIKSDIAPISFKSGDIFKDINFKGIKYKLGVAGKSLKVLIVQYVQLCLNFNNKKILLRIKRPNDIF